MSFYIMSDDGQLLERQDSCPSEADLREYAEDYECDVWVIEGENAGIGYDRPTPPEDPRDKLPVDTMAGWSTPGSLGDY